MKAPPTCACLRASRRPRKLEDARGGANSARGQWAWWLAAGSIAIGALGCGGASQSPAAAVSITARPAVAALSASTVATGPASAAAMRDTPLQVDVFCTQLTQAQRDAQLEIPGEVEVTDLSATRPVSARAWLTAQGGDCMRGAFIAWGIVAEHPRLVVRGVGRSGLDADLRLRAHASAANLAGAAGLSELRLGGDRQLEIVARQLIDVDGDGREELLLRTRELRGAAQTTQVRVFTTQNGGIVEHALTAGSYVDLAAAPAVGAAPLLAARGPQRCKSPSVAADARKSMYVYRHDGKMYRLATEDSRARALQACPKKPERLSDVPALDVECMKLWGATATELEAAYATLCTAANKSKLCTDTRKKADEFACWANAPTPPLLSSP